MNRPKGLPLLESELPEPQTVTNETARVQPKTRGIRWIANEKNSDIPTQFCVCAFLVVDPQQQNVVVTSPRGPVGAEIHV